MLVCGFVLVVVVCVFVFVLSVVVVVSFVIVVVLFVVVVVVAEAAEAGEAETETAVVVLVVSVLLVLAMAAVRFRVVAHESRSRIGTYKSNNGGGNHDDALGRPGIPIVQIATQIHHILHSDTSMVLALLLLRGRGGS